MSLFSSCTHRELTRIESLTTLVDVPAGEVLTEQGAPGEEFFVVVEGTATASRNGLTLATLGPGSFFGELALLDGGNRTATVVADSDMGLLVLSRREFKSLQLTVPSVAFKLLTEMGARLRSTDGLLDKLVDPRHKGTPELAAVLVHLGHPDFVDTSAVVCALPIRRT